MNLLCVNVDSDDAGFEGLVRQWRSLHQIVETLPADRVPGYLRFEVASRLASVDAIVCYALSSHTIYDFPLGRAILLASDVDRLPESCAMRDGRKWRRLPFVILHDSPFFYEAADDDTQAILKRVPPTHGSSVTAGLGLQIVRKAVDRYFDNLLKDYVKLGMLVRFENGHAQIGPALRKKRPRLETEYYHPASDRRAHHGWLTVARDGQGLGADVAMFAELLDQDASETAMQRFFEEHPSFLMEAMVGVPIPHPRFATPTGWSPDFGLSPILGPVQGGIGFLELKGPADLLLNRRPHAGFSAKVHIAVDQVRDYSRCAMNRVNFDALLKYLGYFPTRHELAVLIGRMPASGPSRELLERRRAELDVKVVTYDEVLETQFAQMGKMR